jgi:hypothetical protein
MPGPGQMLGDRYRLEDRIAGGGMGEVWQATDTVLGRDVAVKTLNTDRASDPGFQTRFQHEARAMAALHHPNVADVYDYGQSGTDAYIVMARVDGEPLDRRIAERGRLTAAETMSVVAQAGRALDAAHQAGIVHRDVKPGNLIIRPDGAVVLVDFGVARSAESSTLTGAKEVVGTALYIAPEQVSKQVTGPAADIYALGAVAYHCVAGRPPFLGDNPIAVALNHLNDDPPPLPDDVPGPVRALVATALAKNPADRFPSAAAMAAAAEAAATMDGTASAPGGAAAAIGGAAAAGGTAAALGGAAAAGAAAAALTPYDTGRPTVDAPGDPEVPADGVTAVRPASADGDTTVLPPAAPPAKRRRGGLLAGVLGLLTLAAVTAVLAFVSPGTLFPGGPDPSTAVTISPDTGGAGGAPASSGAGDSGATDDGSGNDGGRAETTSPDRSPAETVGPTRSAGAPATSVTPSRNPTASPRASTTTRTTTTPSPRTTTGGATRQTTSAAIRVTIPTLPAAVTPLTSG